MTPAARVRTDPMSARTYPKLVDRGYPPIPLWYWM